MQKLNVDIGRETTSIFRCLFFSELSRASILLIAVLLLVFLPFATGRFTLLASSRDVPSIYSTGAAGSNQGPNLFKSNDAGAFGWQSEPALKVEQNEIVAEHNVPLWNPYWAYGAPLAADTEFQPYYPLTAAVSLRPTPLTYNWFILARFFVAGFFTFLWLRCFVRFWPASIGAVAFMLSGYFILYYGMGHLSVEVLLPFLLYSSEQLIRRCDPRSTGLVALAVLFLILGGFPESTLLVLAFGYLYTLFRLIVRLEVGGGFFKLCGLFALANLAGLSASMFFVVPSVEALGMSLTGHESQYTGQVNGLIATHFDRSVATYLVPLAMGPAWNNIFNNFSNNPPSLYGYFGVIAVLLALIAIIATVDRLRCGAPSMKDLLTWFFSAMTVLLLLKRYGSPIVNWIGVLPLFKIVTIIKYEEPLMAISIAALCAIGAATVMDGTRRRVTAAAFLATLLLVTGVYLAFVADLSRAVHAEFFYYGLFLALGLTLAGGATLLLSTWGAPLRFQSGIQKGLLALLLVDLSLNYMAPVFYFENNEPSVNISAYVGAPYIKELQRLTERSRARIYSQDYLLYPDWASAFDLGDVRFNGAFVGRTYLSFFKAFFPGQSSSLLAEVSLITGGSPLDLSTRIARRFMALSSIQYIASVNSLPEFTKIDGRGPDIYRVENALPRAAVFFHVTTVFNNDSALHLLTAPRMDIHKDVVLTLSRPKGNERADLRALERGPRLPATAAEILSYTSQRVEILTHNERPGLLMLNDSFYPGWQAYVDEKPAPTLLADYMFRGVVLTPGTHRISFKYEPRSFWLGALLSAVGLVIIVYLLFNAPRPRLSARRST